MYGPHGVGKNSFAASAPNPIFLPLEDGKGDLDYPEFPLLTSYGQVVEAIGALFNESHEHKTVVIDSIDWLEPLIWKETCARREWDSIESPGYGKGYLAADELWREFFSGLVALREIRKMGVILLSHCMIKKFNDPNNEPYDRYQLKLHDRASALVQEWADAVFFANYKVYTEKTEVGFNKKVVRGAGYGERAIFTEERPAHLAKNRWSLPPEIPFPKENSFSYVMSHVYGQASQPQRAHPQEQSQQQEQPKQEQQSNAA